MNEYNESIEWIEQMNNIDIALNHFKELKEDIIKYNDYFYVHDYLTLDDIINAIKALESQIPKKAKAYFGWNTLITWECAKCGKKINSPMGYAVHKYPFCPYCGQAVEWKGVK